MVKNEVQEHGAGAINNGACKRLALAAGVSRVSNMACGEIKIMYAALAEDIFDRAVIVCEHLKVKTISLSNIEHSIVGMGGKLYPVPHADFDVCKSTKAVREVRKGHGDCLFLSPTKFRRVLPHSERRISADAVANLQYYVEQRIIATIVGAKRIMDLVGVNTLEPRYLVVLLRLNCHPTSGVVFEGDMKSKKRRAKGKK